MDIIHIIILLSKQYICCVYIKSICDELIDELKIAWNLHKNYPNETNARVCEMMAKANPLEEKRRTYRA